MLLAAVMGGANAVVSALPGPPTRPEQEHLRWKGRSITLSVSSSVVQPNPNFKPDSDVIGAIRRSVDAWQAAAGLDIQIEFTDKQSVSPSGGAGDGISILTIAQTPDNVLLFSKDPKGGSAKTRVFYNKKGNVTEADIVLNPFEQFSTDGAFGTFDLEATIKHEIGHLLGLHHSAVLGSVMSDSIPRNDASGGERINSDLAACDVAAIRELYGAPDDDADCCSSIAGKLNIDRGARDLRVWAEETDTGRVVGQAKVAADGSFRIGGLTAGSYTVNWQRTDTDGKSVGLLSTVKISKNETRTLSERNPATRSTVSLELIGSSERLGDSAYHARGGREYTILVGGRQLNANSCSIEFSSPLIMLRPGSVVTEQFEDGMTALRFSLSTDEKLQPGAYTVYVTSGASRSALIGSIRVN
ncbi:MAG: matrixin family metalloprotease [Acidobacteria bacterium]|nr:matrixin family metalloprotease [Acidobacteriota bacterium]